MNTVKKIACFLIAAAMFTGFAACGKKQELTSSETTTETAAEAAAASSEEDDSEEDDESDDDAPIDLDKVSVKGKETNAPKATTATAVTTAVTTAASGATTAVTTAKAGSTTQKAGQTDAKQTETQAMTDPAPENDAPPEEKTVSGVIDLGSGSFEGEGITVDGGTVRITGSGTYILSGSRSGMVEVNTTAKVKLKLNGVNISNPDGPAILCTDAKRLTITLIEGTYNELNDGGGAHDGTITSNDTLEIKGAGTLRVNGNVGHGISSDDDIIIKNGDITVNAVKSGMMANDDITVSGGTLHITGQTNGMKSKGTLHIEGGSMWIYGGPKENKSSLFSGGPFTITGGSIYALGCGVTEPDGSSSQCSIAVRYNPGQEGGTAASLNLNGNQIMWESSPYAFNTLFVSTPDIHEGNTFTVYINGEQYGDEYTVNGVAASASVEKKVEEPEE